VDQPALAVHCRYLRRALDHTSPEGVLTICQHPIREGTPCVGPFLDDLTTRCGLWELHPDRELMLARRGR
jgi:hypothetical protein